MSLEEIAQKIREIYPDATYVTLEVNYQGYEIQTNYRTPEVLKSDGISMRSLNGEWIK